MSPTTINIFDKFLVEIKGNSPTKSSLESYYEMFQEKGSNNIDLVCSFGNLSTKPERILGDPRKYYGKDGSDFVKDFPRKKFLINNSWDVMKFSNNIPMYDVYLLIEYLARLKLIEDQIAVIHASGVEIRENGIIFPAWRNTGKTNTMLSLLLKYDNSSYLSDDRVFASQDEVYGFPVKAHMAQFNYKSFPEIDQKSTVENIKHNMKMGIDRFIKESNSSVAVAIRLLTKKFLDVSADKILVDELIPTTGHCQRTGIDAIVFLQRTNSTHVELEKLDSTTAQKRLKAMTDYEWNSGLERLLNIHQYLFPQENRFTEFKQFTEKEASIYTDIVQNNPTFLLTVPGEEQWRKHNLGEEINQKLTEFGIIPQ